MCIEYTTMNTELFEENVRNIVYRYLVHNRYRLINAKK